MLPGRGREASRASEPQSGRLIQQRLQHRLFESRRGGRVVEHLLERLVDARGLDDLSNGVRDTAQHLRPVGSDAEQGMLRDDQIVPARPIRPDDRDELRRAIQAADPQRWTAGSSTDACR